MIDFVVGGIAQDDDFFFREEFIADLWDILRKDHILLLASRRMGKSSVMNQMLHNPKNDVLPVKLNVEDINNSGDFLLKLIGAIQEHQEDFFKKILTKTWQLIKNILGQIDTISLYDLQVKLRKSDDWKSNWQQRGNELIEVLENSQKKLLIILDELPDMIIEMKKHHPQDVIPFLHFFRRVRQKEDTNIRWLVGGSVNIRGTLEQMNQVKLINDFKFEFLQPFTADEVTIFMTCMMEDRKVIFDENVIPKTLVLLGSPIPVFLQMFTQELYRYWRKHQKVLTTDSVDQVFNESLLGEVAKDKLHHNRDRIELYYPEKQKTPAYKILTEISRSETGITKRQLKHFYYQHAGKQVTLETEVKPDADFDQLMYFLQTDFYIEEMANGKYDFSSHLLKLWWKKNYA
ncbi:MAG: hypothetical protein HQ510_05420 [Candidatus Marinimicrobia bacterium]|nr:hypothetical protein [Candidatus Neomarinimicrobiota bacterium]